MTLSYKVFMQFIGDDGDATRLLSRECYEAWVKARKGKLKQPEESFRRVLTAHVCGMDARKPFPEKVEKSLLKMLRKKEVWECFKGTDVVIGIRGFRNTGYHQGKSLARQGGGSTSKRMNKVNRKRHRSESVSEEEQSYQEKHERLMEQNRRLQAQLDTIQRQQMMMSGQSGMQPVFSQMLQIPQNTIHGAVQGAVQGTVQGAVPVMGNQTTAPVYFAANQMPQQQQPGVKQEFQGTPVATNYAPTSSYTVMGNQFIPGTQSVQAPAGWAYSTQPQIIHSPNGTFVANQGTVGVPTTQTTVPVTMYTLPQSREGGDAKQPSASHSTMPVQQVMYSVSPSQQAQPNSSSKEPRRNQATSNATSAPVAMYQYAIAPKTEATPPKSRSSGT